MEEKLLNYAKTHRKKAGLSQSELSYLFGDKSTSFVLKTERGLDIPSLSRALSYQILFDVQADKLFVGLTDRQRAKLFRKVIKLTKTLELQTQNPANTRKLRFLNSTARRIASNPKTV